ncbi:class II fructose-bisphosphate aldolase [Mahella australiensis]|uniref:Ketose-bisphosphate aldolase n=1 Tax=Mahella australiensis (strain DSM 15567 / CIP 107919 / 50-1 BON) TaxID=697281 RepID=F4A271_MAHA5|nr:class II fructose-bisphosphate aldolase [Mahella australiensis]AEE97210.1 ketose-bisphosphate aldolase [Mahella australiensis 50-1 BON]
MSKRMNLSNVFTLKEILKYTSLNGYAVGAFSARYTPMIRSILRAGQKCVSPVIVQISQKEINKYQVAVDKFAREFYAAIMEEGIDVPVTLHLDHTKDFAIIEKAINADFTSVMIDASDKPLEENIAITREVVKYAHDRGVSVEAELGKISTTDFIETDSNGQLYTDPREAKIFIEETGADALAVSVGTAHGPYEGKRPNIDYQRLQAIKAAVDVPLVLHGASGVPADMVMRAIHLDGGGVSKVNIATDLEAALLESLGYEASVTDAQLSALDNEILNKAAEAVEETVRQKIERFLGSQGHAADFNHIQGDRK